MRKKAIAWSVGLVLGLPVVFAVTAAVLVNTLDQQALLNKVATVVKEKQHRTLTFGGPVQLKWFPSIGADLQAVSLTEPQGDEPFLSAEKVNVSLALMPLFRGHVVVDGVSASGVTAHIVKNKEGKFNFADLSEQKVPEDGKRDAGNKDRDMDFSAQAISLEHLNVQYEDQQTGRVAELKNFNVSTGRIAQGVDSKIKLKGHLLVNKPAADLLVDISTGLNFQWGEQKDIRLYQFVSSLTGKLDQQVLDLSLKAPELRLASKAVSGDDIQFKATAQQANSRSLKTDFVINQLAGSLDQSMRANIDGQVDVVDPALPKKKMSVPIKGSLSLNEKAQQLDVALSSQLEATRFNLKAGLKNFSKPAIQAILNADTLDLDTLFPPKKAAAADTKKETAQAPNDSPIDLSFLKPLDLDLKTQIKNFKVSGIALSNLRADILSREGKLTVAPFSADLYGGSTSGVMSVDANAQVFAINQHLKNVQVLPLLKDVAKKEVLEGKGNVTLDMHTQGATVSALKSHLNGKLALSLKDGAIRGIDLEQKLKEVKSFLSTGTNDIQASNTDQKTKFSALSVSFAINNGVASSSDLNVIAPYLKLGGQGKVNLVNNNLDYLLNANVLKSTGSPSGVAPDMALAGVAVPVHVYGDFSALQWEIVYKDIAKSALKAKLKPKIEAKKEELKAKIQDKLRGLLSR